MIRRIRPGSPAPADGRPWVADIRLADIPSVVAGCIRSAAPGLVAISLRRSCPAMAEAAQQAAAARGVRIVWLPA